MAINIERKRGGESNSRYVLVGALIIFAFFASYSYAASSRSAAKNNAAYAGGAQLAQAGGAGAAGGGCGMSGGAGGGCCGGGGPAVEGKTTVEGNVQKLTIDTSQGSFNPNTIKAKAGVPLELTFTQAPGGCLSGVLFPALNISEDLTAGQKTIKLPALQKGEYQFSCQMQMVSGKLVVE